MTTHPPAPARQAAYRAALLLVERIDKNLAYRRWYRTRAGERLTTLEQVVRAILNDTLAI